MRTIKFRGKRIDNGEWVYGHYVPNSVCARIVEDFAVVKAGKYTDDNLSHCSGEFHIVNSTSVGQFTGLTDKNGKEIYEGDILKQEKWVSVGKYAEATGVVVFKSPLFTVECIGDWHGSNADLNCNSEIIGNTTDNPEFLTK